MSKPTLREIAGMIDHSLLHPTMTDAEIRDGCKLARSLGCASACVKPYSIEMCKQALDGSETAVCSVIGFPHGNSSTAVKVFETVEAAKAGATEIDMVINIGKALGGDWAFVGEEIGAIHKACRDNGAILKVIFENDFLEESHIATLCEICGEDGVEYVKTSTGYGFVKQPGGGYSYKGATREDLKLMRERSPESVRIKAAGGVRTLDDLLACREIGVDRIGASATKTILEEARQRGFI